MFAAARNGRDRMFMRLLWHTGGRLSEVLALRVGDVEVEQQGLRLRNLKQGTWIEDKTGGRRHVADPDAEKLVFVPADFVEELRAFTAGLPLDAYVISRPDGGPYTRRRLAQIVEQAAIDAGVLKRRHPGEPARPATPHMFRHGAAVNLLLAGAPITAVQEQLGHANLASTQRYTRLTDEQRRAAVARAEF